MEHITNFPKRCEQVTLLGKKALYVEERIHRSTLPQGLYAYDLRGSDYDFTRPVTLEKHVVVNHAGTIITAQPIPLPEQGYIDIGRRLRFKDEHCSLREFELSAYPERLTEEERLAQIDLQQQVQSYGLERAFLNSPTDAYAIYQLREIEENRHFLFAPLEQLRKDKQAVEHHRYILVYTDGLDNPEQEPAAILDDLYYRFHMAYPRDYTGHSLSVSDVVALKRDGNIQTYYVDRVGFRELDDFLPANALRNAEMLLEDDDSMIDGIINNGKKEPEDVRPSVAEQLHTPCKPGQHKPAHPSRGESR